MLLSFELASVKRFFLFTHSNKENKKLFKLRSARLPAPRLPQPERRSQKPAGAVYPPRRERVAVPLSGREDGGREGGGLKPKRNKEEGQQLLLIFTDDTRVRASNEEQRVRCRKTLPF